MPLTLSQRESKIQKLKVKLERDKLNESLMAKYNYLEAEQKRALANMLHEENEAFRTLAAESATLLVNQNIPFKVTREHGATHSNFTKQLRGAIHSNGYLYLVNQVNTGLFAFWNQYLTPKSFLGRINPIGLADLQLNQVNSALIGNRVPQSFLGSISSDGAFYLKVTESYWESKGGYFVKNAIGDPFKRDEHKRIAFLEKRHKLHQEIALLRQKLC